MTHLRAVRVRRSRKQGRQRQLFAFALVPISMAVLAACATPPTDGSPAQTAPVAQSTFTPRSSPTSPACVDAPGLTVSTQKFNVLGDGFGKYQVSWTFTVRNDSDEDVSGYRIQRRDVVGDVATAWRDVAPASSTRDRLAAGQAASQDESLLSIYKLSDVEYRATTSTSPAACGNE